MPKEQLNAAQVGKMFVTRVTFEYHEKGEHYNSETGKYDKRPAFWEISARLSSTTSRHNSNSQDMSIQVEEEIGQELARVLLPVIVADASKKAQQLADDSKAMLEALGNRTLACITDMQAVSSPKKDEPVIQA